jgi:membrane protease YdiL (CAAX protease family)
MTTTSTASEVATRPAILRRPVLLWVAYLGTVTGIALAAKALWPHLLSGPSGLSPLQVGLQALITLLVIPFALAVGWRAIGMTRRVSMRSVAVVAFPALTIVVGFLGGFREASVVTVLLALASVALAGFSEELAFRGVFLTLLQPRGLWPAVILSSALFGLMHLTNLALGSAWYTVLLQVTFAGMSGLGYAAMRLRTGSLWVPIVLHALYDLTFRLGTVEPGSPFQYLIFMLHGVGWAIYAVIVLRPSVRNRLTY